MPTARVGIYQWQRSGFADGPPQGDANKKMERSEQESPLSLGRRQEFAEHRSALPKRASCAKRALQGLGVRQPITYLRFAFAGTLGEFDKARKLDEGILRVLWMTLEEVRNSQDRHRSPLVLQCIVDHQAGQRIPLTAINHYPS